MILNKPETEPWSITNLPGKIVISGLLLYLFVRFAAVLWNITPDPSALEAPEAVAMISAQGPTTVAFGSTKALGNTLFTDFLFPFEAVSLVLLIAVVGAIAVARPHEPALETVIPEGAEGTPAPGSAAKS
jgi:NADH:ubiquinone oxidoreductase subunit 6 (subunit J)